MTSIIGLDVGFATFGYAVVEPDKRGNWLPVVVGTWTTAPSPKRHGVLVAHDDVRRVQELLTYLHALISNYRPACLCVELPSGSKGARAAAALGIAKAIVAAVAHRYDLPIAACTPRELKLAVTGKANASKEDVRQALDGRFSMPARGLNSRDSCCGVPPIEWPKRKADVEHAADALGAVVACFESDVAKMARHMGGRGAVA